MFRIILRLVRSDCLELFFLVACGFLVPGPGPGPGLSPCPGPRPLAIALALGPFLLFLLNRYLRVFLYFLTHGFALGSI